MLFLSYLSLSIIISLYVSLFFFFNDPATPEIYTLSLHDALPIFPRHALGVDPGPADEIGDVGSVHGDARSLPDRDLTGDLAAQLADLTLQLAYARLARVARDDLSERRVGHRELFRGQAVLGELAQHEIPLRDLELLALGVAREVHGLEPVEQRSRNALEEVRGRDEVHLRQ